LFAKPFIVVIACTTPQIVVRPALLLIKLKTHQISVSWTIFRCSSETT